MFPTGLKVHCFVYSFAILVTQSGANIMSETEFSTFAVSNTVSPYVFVTHRHVDIVGCIKECREDYSCKFINYNTRRKLCSLNHNILPTSSRVSAHITVNKKKLRGNACWLKPWDTTVSTGTWEAFQDWVCVWGGWGTNFEIPRVLRHCCIALKTHV